MRQLLARFGSAAALEALPDLARRGGGEPPVVPSRAVIETEVATVEAAGRPTISSSALPGYPADAGGDPDARRRR